MGLMSRSKARPLAQQALGHWARGGAAGASCLAKLGTGVWRGRGRLNLRQTLGGIEGVNRSIVVVVIIVAVLDELLKVDLVSKETTNTAKALDELVTLGGTVRDELESSTEILVVLGNPLQEGALLDNLHLLAGGLVEEHVAAGLLLSLSQVEDDILAFRVAKSVAGNFEVLKDDQSLDSTELESLEGIFETVADLAGVLANLFKVLANELLLLDKLDVAERLSRQLNGLVEAVVTTVRNINNLDDLGLETGIEHVGAVEIVLEIGGTSQDKTSDVGLVVGDEVLHGQLSDLAHVVVTLLVTETRETQSGLTTTSVLLGKIDGELVKNLAGVAGEGAKECAVTVHDDEAEPLVGLEQLRKSLGVELVVAQVQGGVDGLEGLEVDVDLALLAFLGQDFTTVQDKAVRGNLVVELEASLCGRNGRQDGLSVDTRLNVGGGTLQSGG